MSDQIQQAKKASAEVYWALRDTQEGGHSCVSVSITTEMSLDI